MGCEEKFDAEFFWWIMHEGRTKARRAQHEAHFAAAKQGVRPLHAPPGEQVSGLFACPGKGLMVCLQKKCFAPMEMQKRSL